MSFHCFSIIGYPKTLFFKSFTGLTLKEFDDFYNKEIAKRYSKHEIQRLSTKRKYTKRERKDGARGRPFKLDIKNRFLIWLVFTIVFTSPILLLVFSLTLIRE
ncbi:MAG: hypothetical protein ABJB76_02205 [Candidatus Nitrosocosmicus sp.]